MSADAREPAGDYTHSWLASPAAIAAEAPAWDRIVEEAYGGNPFLSAGWHQLWLRHFAPEGGRVCYLRVERRGQVAAYFPLLGVVERFHRVEVRALRFAGNMYSPVLGPVIAPGAPADLFDHVVRRALPEVPWTVLLADELALEHAGPAELHAALSAAGHSSHLVPGEGNWHLAFRGGAYEAYLAARTPKLRGRLRQAQRRTAELGPVEVRLASSGVTDEDIEAYRSVYDRSWKEPELDPTFHPAMMRWAAERGSLRLFTLRAAGRPIASQLWLVHGGRAYAVKHAYDEAYGACSPGNFLLARVMEHLLDVEGVGEIDFLRGDDAYKREWCDRRRQRLSLVAFSRDPAGRAASFLDRALLPWLRRRPALAALRRRLSTALRAGS